MRSDQLVSLWEMLEINASAFLAAATELRRLNTVIENNSHLDGGDEDVDPGLRGNLLGTLAGVIDAINVIGARAAAISANRLKTSLLDGETPFPFKSLDRALHDIESRFADEVSFIKLFVIDHSRATLMENAEKLLGEQTAKAFPSVWFDVEESAKCICLGRSTAAVFHAMRIVELGIRAFARKLNIPDPTRPAERNWGAMLNSIKAEIDSQYSAAKRLPGTEGAFLEGLYATLDAIKNPWRNATMHVESVYTEEEARHIIACVGAFIQKMASGFDEEGRAVEAELATTLIEGGA